MISANPWTLPSYSSIYAGAMDVLDGVQIDGSSTWVHSLPTPSGFTQQTMDIPASRAMKGTLTLDPTIVPEKLRALRGMPVGGFQHSVCRGGFQAPRSVPGRPAAG